MDKKRASTEALALQGTLKWLDKRVYLFLNLLIAFSQDGLKKL
jgi:hypothetical protein